MCLRPLQRSNLLCLLSFLLFYSGKSAQPFDYCGFNDRIHYYMCFL
uniref:Uncharacterized protein n=1 Tax=Rhizophora mucronata TaxID=61149 RepID=A0A2P2MMJ6_RHIMU